MRYAPSLSTPASKALTDAIAHHEHQTEQLQHAVRMFTLHLRARGLALDEVLTELRVVFGRSIHLDGAPRDHSVPREVRLDSLMKLAREGYASEPGTLS